MGVFSSANVWILLKCTGCFCLNCEIPGRVDSDEETLFLLFFLFSFSFSFFLQALRARKESIQINKQTTSALSARSKHFPIRRTLIIVLNVLVENLHPH